MTIRMTKPQTALLGELNRNGDKGVIKSTSDGSACALVESGHAIWQQKYSGNRTGLLVITPIGRGHAMAWRAARCDL
ncbi:hypothetical protein HDIA_0759 [Hartmannibacter diazotrophicus]|uniref:Uncharacterized protein n=1 Tax=Hartmannibacter diazotrophicus TaxID=1482074 RepID=A0A2C9D228_9HYPH|nr:hypothetical protein [Hartmannibacter diazotrophicus]SON54300.1 hypothetical protein HDIA_0759 [Hartmannibacter diazotrophicus]